MFKNAGSSLDSILSQNFGSKFIDHREDDLMRRGKQGYIEDYLMSHENVKALSSHHLPMPLYDTSLFEFKTIILLREPVVRIPSVYRFERQQNGVTPGAIAAKKYNIADYIRWRLDVRPGTVCNYFTNFITTNLNVKNEEDKFQQAKNIIKNVFMVGIVEEFSNSIKVLNSKIKHYYPNFYTSLVRENATDCRDISLNQRKLEFRTAIGDQLYEDIKMRNVSDAGLYKTALERLKDQMSTINV